MSYKCIVIDVGTWNDGYIEKEIISKVKWAIRKKPNEIYITGNFSKWLNAMGNDYNFATDCLKATFNNEIIFTDDGGNNKIYSIYDSLLKNNDLADNEKINNIYSLKESYSSLNDFLQDIESKNLSVKFNLAI